MDRVTYDALVAALNQNTAMLQALSDEVCALRSEVQALREAGAGFAPSPAQAAPPVPPAQAAPSTRNGYSQSYDEPANGQSASTQTVRRYQIAPGERAKQCKGCQATIYWAKTEAGKNMPVNPDGTPHWENCPARGLFKGGDS